MQISDCYHARRVKILRMNSSIIHETIMKD
jgi:hypothetical protein